MSILAAAASRYRRPTCWIVDPVHRHLVNAARCARRVRELGVEEPSGVLDGSGSRRLATSARTPCTRTGHRRIGSRASSSARRCSREEMSSVTRGPRGTGRRAACRRRGRMPGDQGSDEGQQRQRGRWRGPRPCRRALARRTSTRSAAPRPPVPSHQVPHPDVGELPRQHQGDAQRPIAAGVVRDGDAEEGQAPRFGGVCVQTAYARLQTSASLCTGTTTSSTGAGVTLDSPN